MKRAEGRALSRSTSASCASVSISTVISQSVRSWSRRTLLTCSSTNPACASTLSTLAREPGACGVSICRISGIFTAIAPHACPLRGGGKLTCRHTPAFRRIMPTAAVLVAFLRIRDRCGTAQTAPTDPKFNTVSSINGESNVYWWRPSWNPSARSSYCLPRAQDMNCRPGAGTVWKQLPAAKMAQARRCSVQ